MFLYVQIDFIVLKTYDQQFTSATRKSLRITFNVTRMASLVLLWC